MPPVCRHRRRVLLGGRDVRRGLLHHAEPNRLARAEQRQLGIGQLIRREGGEQCARRRALAAEIEAAGVIGKHARCVPPVLGSLGVADRLDRILVLRVPAGGRLVQLANEV